MSTPEEMDSHTAPMWSRHMEEIDLTGEVIVDMANTTFCDSCGIGAMVHLAQRTQVSGGKIALINAAPIVDRSIRLLALDGVLGLE